MSRRRSGGYTDAVQHVCCQVTGTAEEQWVPIPEKVGHEAVQLLLPYIYTDHIVYKEQLMLPA